MKKLTSLFATCILVLSLSGTALADGGITQGPGMPSPAPGGTGAAANAEAQSHDVLSEWTLFVTWFEQSIL